MMKVLIFLVVISAVGVYATADSELVPFTSSGVAEFDLLTQATRRHHHHRTDVKPLLKCKTMATTGPKHWGHAIVYCPKGWSVTGGGMQSNFAAFERAHPYYNGFMCDNNHGWGSGICFARCCKIPGFQYVSPEAAVAGIPAGKESTFDNIHADEHRGAIVKKHMNSPYIKYYARATQSMSSPEHNILHQWTRALSQQGYCSKALSDFTEVSNHNVCHGPRRGIMYRFVVKIFPLTQGTWKFKLGSTFAGGGAMYVDGKLVADARGLPQNWDGTWNPSTSLLRSGLQSLEAKKWHTVDVFGFSGTESADDPMDMVFKFMPGHYVKGQSSAHWKPVSVGNLEIACD